MRGTSLLLVLVLAFAQCAFAYEYSLLKLSGPITEEMKDSVSSAGFEIVGYAGDYTYIVRVPVNRLNQAETNAVIGFEGLAPLNPELKIATSISSKPALTHLDVLLFSGEDANSILDEINAIVPAEKYNDELITVESATNEQMGQIAEIQGIMFIDEYHSKEIFNEYAAPTLGASGAWSVLNITGSSVIVAVGDTGMDTGNLATIHHDLRGRVINISAWCDGTHGIGCSGNPNGIDYHGHGTHVSGSVLGNGSVDSAIKGMAPKARLFIQSLNPDGSNSIYTPDDLGDLFQEAKNQGATIHTNSWGSRNLDCSSPGYTSDSYNVDRFSNSSKDFTIFFSAGNCGEYGSNTIGSPGTAKNAITIGAVGTARGSYGYSSGPNEIASFSSRGPTTDGRIKPDLVAPGVYIYSTCSYYSCDVSDSYQYMSGTSMATPLSAGTGALVTEYMKTQRSSAHPSSALIKAVLVAGADSIPAYGDLPNNVIGFGRINLTKSLAIAPNYYMNFSDRQYNLSTDQSRTFLFTANATVTPKIALVWTDPPGSQLINDLDLKVTLPNGSWYYGNKHTLNLPSASADHVNNVELVIVDSPAAGTYNVTVSGYNVAIGPQDFALVTIYASGASANATNSTNLSACGTLNRSNTIYTLASNVASSGTCFTFAAQNITLDCRNHSITGTGAGDSRGILIQNYDSGTVQDCVISGYDSGIRISNSSGDAVTDNSLDGNGIGISLSSATGNTLSGCTIRDNSDYGIFATGSSSNTIYNNIIQNPENFYLSSSSASWCVSPTSGTNIIGGSWIAGNYWANPTGTGFSETCTDANHDGLCDSAYTLAVNNSDCAPLTYVAYINLTLPTSELWTRSRSKTLRMYYTLFFGGTNSTTCELYNSSGVRIGSARHSLNGTYYLTTRARFRAEGRYDYNITCYPTYLLRPEATETFSAYYDRTRPVVGLAYNATVHSNTTYVNVTPTDTVAQYIACTVGSNTSTIQTGTTHSFLVPLPRVGRNTVRVTCYDQAMNKARSTIRITRLAA